MRRQTQPYLTRAVWAGIVAGLCTAGTALADSAPTGNPFSKYAEDGSVVAAVQTMFDAPAGQSVRIAVYDSEENFLEMAAVKHAGKLDETGLALVHLRGLPKGEYSFAAYLDQNADGKLNRSAIGLPKEPFAFSNGVVPKLRKPRFDETKVDVAPGSVVVITLED